MSRQNLIVAACACAVCADAYGSRRFAGPEHLDYDSGGVPFVDGLMTFGLSVWIKRTEDPADVREIIHNADPGDEHGFRLMLEPAPATIRFVYHGDLAAGGPDEITVSGDVSAIDPGTWFHVAVDLDLTASTVRMFIDGEEQSIALPFLGFAPMNGDRHLYLGDRPLTVASGVPGDVHDVGIVDHLWTADEIEVLQRHALSDVTSGLRFNPRLRADATDPVSGVEPTVVGEERRGMGPVIAYADQPPTVLVIGDTQNLDVDVSGEDTSQAVEMARLGRFIHDYRDTLRIAAVFHVGDWVNAGGPVSREVVRARALVDEFRLDSIPWACTLGNHDYGLANRTVDYWRSDTDWTMPTWLFDSQPWHVTKLSDTSPSLPIQDKEYAHAFVFHLDGHPQLGIALPYAPTQEMFEWVRNLAAVHADKSVWISTHDFTQPPGRLDTRWWTNPQNYPGLEGGPRAALFDYLEHMPNLAMVMSGHFVGTNRRCDSKRESGGPGGVELGNHRSLLVNAQHTDFGLGEPGTQDDDGRGYMQLVAIDTAEGVASVETYITLYDLFHNTHLSRFSFEVTFDEPCVITDCNENGYDDDDDIYWGDSEDCDEDGVPDECQVAVICELDLSEMRIGPETPDDRYEYLEIAGRFETDLRNVVYVVLGDAGDEGDSGRVEMAEPVEGELTNDDGLLVIAGPNFALGTPDRVVADFEFDRFDNTTHLLVETTETITVGDDLDADDDGVLDVEPWVRRWGEVAFVHEVDGGEHVYTDNRVGPDEATGGAPWHVLDCDNQKIGVDCPDWELGDPNPGDGIDSPGGVNPACACCLSDLDGDGMTGFADVLPILAMWGQACGGCPEDLDGSGVIDFPDLLVIFFNWGPCP
jgi:hypothetical protein